MNKLLRISLLTLLGLFLFAGSSYAASTSIRLQSPASQTNKDTFNLTFVALDTNPDQAVSVQCYKKGPSDGAFSAFGGVINLSNGGNTDNCQVTSGVVNQGTGTYQFYAQVVTGSTTPTSNTVSIDYNNSKPGQPVNYKKEKPDACTYKISFRTADDSGKTIKVYLYRSTDRGFDLDASHLVNTTNIGSSTDGSMTDNISPNCNTEYFYAIRAFDTYGNGSEPNGDTNTTITTINPTGTQGQVQGAIALTDSENGVSNGATKGVLGEASDSAKKAEADAKKVSGRTPVTDWILSNKQITLFGILVFAAIAYYLYQRRFKKVK